MSAKVIPFPPHRIVREAPVIRVLRLILAEARPIPAPKPRKPRREQTDNVESGTGPTLV
jgi:hypothetical protein